MWRKTPHEFEGDDLEARGGHSSTLVGKKIFLFGGQYFRSRKQGFISLNDIFLYDLETEALQKLKTEGQSPSPRFHHSTSLINSRLVVFGGHDSKRYFSDLHSFDIEKKIWFQGPSSGGPSPRAGHSAEVYENQLFVFGGMCGIQLNERKYLNDIHKLDLKTMRWDLLETVGEKPCKRAFHSHILVCDKIIFFGGLTHSDYNENLKNSYLNDCYVFEIPSLTWTRLVTFGIPPKPRFSASFELLENSLLLLGGWEGTKTGSLVELTFDDFTWKEAEELECRYGHTSCEVDGKIYIFLGWNGEKALRNFLILQKD